MLVAAVLPSVAVEIDLAGGANGGIGEEAPGTPGTATAPRRSW
ncbi:hypothetical protein [Leucobacter soli]